MHIYYVAAISLDVVTESDLKREYEIHKIKYNKKSTDFTYENFLKFKKGWKEDKYNISSFISSYHLSKEEALEYATFNIGDINESGSYPYAGVVSAPVGHSYYNTCQNPKEDFVVLKYNYETHKYEEMDKSLPEYQSILYHLWGMIGG